MPTGPSSGALARFASMRTQRWGRAETLAAARRYNALAREAGLTPTQMALAFVLHATGAWPARSSA